MRLAKKQKNTSSKATSGLISRPVIGVDINQNTIRMVLLTGRSLNQIRLEQYVITKLPKNIIKSNRIQDYDQLVTFVQQSYERLKTSSKNIIGAVPQNLATIETVLFNAKDSELSLEDFIESELSQIAPIEEMSYDYQVIDNSSTSLSQKILLTAARKEDVETRIELFETAGIPLSIMDVDVLAQNNAFSYWINQNNPSLANEKIAIFGIYETQMYALIAQNGQILYKQETSVSCEQLSQLIQRTYQVSEEKANQMINSQDKPADYQSQVADKFNMQVAQEVQRVLQFYYTTQENEQFSEIKHILLTGNASQQSGLSEAISSQTNTITVCAHPVLNTTVSNKIDEKQLKVDAPLLTIAFGLALRGL